MDVVISPVGIGRLGGLPADVVKDLATGEAMRIAAELYDIDRLIASEESCLSDLLFDLIGSQTDAAFRRLLVGLRRDLHNRRPVQLTVRVQIESGLSPNNSARILRLSAAIERRARIKAEFLAAYEAELVRTRRSFAKTLMREEFRRGLLLSSQSLFGNVTRYQRVADGTLSGRDEHIERGLLRYASRAATKTSPFSGFSLLAAVNLDELSDSDAVTDLRLSIHPRDVESGVLLNKEILGVLLRHLRERKETRCHLPLYLNPTVWMEAEHVCCLSTNDSREVFRRFAKNDALDLVLACIHSAKWTTMRSLVALLTTSADLDTSELEAFGYVDALVELGLFRIGSGVRDQDHDWDLSLLQTLESPHLREDLHSVLIQDALKKLRESRDRFAGSNTDTRAVELSRALHLLNELFARLGVRASLALGPFLEDCGIGKTGQLAISHATREALDAFSQFIAITAPIAPPGEWQITLRHFFHLSYPEEPAVSALRFFEEFHRREQQLRAEKERSPNGTNTLEDINPFRLPEVDELQRKRGRIAEIVRQKWRAAPDAEEINITADELANSLAIDKRSEATLPYSVSAFTQFANLHGRELLVAPNGSYYAGFGKYFSRFLHVLPEQFLADVRRENELLVELSAAPMVLAEICSDGNFNANLHPPLVTFHIPYPSGGVPPREDELSLEGIDVARDPDHPCRVLLLRRRDGQRITPIDLGFMNPRLRPPLFQFLSKFCQLSGFGLWMPEEPSDVRHRREGETETVSSQATGSDGVRPILNERATASAIQCRPRICFEGKVILARRRWRISSSDFPARGAQETRAEYFYRIQQWRMAYDLPARAFVRVAWVPAPTSNSNSLEPVVATVQESTDASNLQGAVPAKTNNAKTPMVTAVKNVDMDEAATSTDKAYDVGLIATARVSRDFAKPQFIDFQSPLFVNLFEKISAKMENFVVLIEECLPEIPEHDQTDVSGRVSEFVLQYRCTHS